MSMLEMLSIFAATGSNWSINNLLNNVKNALANWGAVIVTIVGLVMVIVAVVQLAKGLIQGQRGQTNWVMVIILFFVGGALAFSGGWSIVQKISDGGSATLNELGGGEIAIVETVDAPDFADYFG